MLVCNLIYADFLLATLYAAVALNVWEAHLKVLNFKRHLALIFSLLFPPISKSF